MSQSFATRLQSAAARNRELLSIIAQNDHAPSALPQNAAYITDLDAQLKKTDVELKKLHAITEDERKDHVEYRDSTFKRYAHKIGGKKGQEKFTSKQEKEEREFLEAWQKEREAIARREEIARALDIAQVDKQTLGQAALQYQNAQTELDQMYAQLFNGPTPEVPGEDQMEQTVQHLVQYLDQCQQRFNTEKSAGEALRGVEKLIAAANKNMREALSMSRMDMMGGGTFIDMMERDALSRAGVAISEAIVHMNAARQLQPAIQPLDNVNIDMGHAMSDMFFDNIFTDMAQHERIQGSAMQLQRADDQLKEQIRLQLVRAGGARDQLAQAKQDTENVREELQRIRAETFETYGQNMYQGQSADAPPPYVG
ncbi:hypothetical protein B0A48_07806 [Cryoendolithus antarcticus]|uniref:Uncharacterized protein n=1 Tax=Cryoendolithus antarcticus TaxID=1507870 RepID=A0A1V8T744_9PEZI|nr:hypothetical protein B0A48_07806 [Cryoendolithus antarcticus]